jgi:GMP synthase-like glutamine amidotransferase
MRVLAIVQQDDAGPGVFADAIRARGMALEVWRPAVEAQPAVDHDAVLVLGGAMDVHETTAIGWLAAEQELLKTLLARGVPTLGVCLGAQLVAAAGGGTVRRASEPEIGWREVRLEPVAGEDPVIGRLPRSFESFQWHSYEAVPPPDATALARSNGSLQAYKLAGVPAWGIQFHAEVDAPTAEAWIAGYRSDPDAVRIGVDPDALRAETAPRLAAWNELGRGLCDRFLDVAGAGATRA